jgi:hypothetical protein
MRKEYNQFSFAASLTESPAMATRSRVEQAITLMRNMTADALTTAFVAVFYERSSRKNPAYTVDEALRAVQNNAAQEEVGRGQRNFNLYLYWMTERFIECETILRRIPSEKVVELRKQGRSTKSIFEEPLSDVLKRLHQSPAGVYACYNQIVDNPKQYDVHVLSLMAKIKSNADGLQRFIRVFRSHILKRLIFDLRPSHVVLASVALLIAIYIIKAMMSGPAGDPGLIVQSIQTDAKEVAAIWGGQDRGTLANVRDTVMLVHQVASLVPFFLMLGAIPLYGLRRFVIKSRSARTRLGSIETYLKNTARSLQLKGSSIINVEEIKVAERITNVENIGPGAIVNIAEYMNNVTNTVNQNIGTSSQNSQVKSLVKDLTSQIKDAASKVDPKTAKQMGDDLEALSKEMANSPPRKKWYELSLDGLKEAAQAIGEIGKPILETIAKLRPLILG